MYVREIKNEDMPTIQVIYAYHVEYGLASWEELPPDLDELILRRDSVFADGFPYLVCKKQRTKERHWLCLTRRAYKALYGNEFSSNDRHHW